MAKRPGPPEADVADIHGYCAAKVPPEYQDQIRVEYTVRGSSVSIFECRPPWQADGGEWTRQAVAQLRYDAGENDWSLYCADRNGRWFVYEKAEPGPLEALLAEIETDPTGIFWG